MTLGLVAGAIVGLLGGYPLSYYWQAQLPPELVGLQDYVEKIWHILTTRGTLKIAVEIWAGSVVACSLLGALTGAVLRKFLAPKSNPQAQVETDSPAAER